MSVDTGKLQIVLDRAGRYEKGKSFFADGWLIGTCGYGLLAVRAKEGEPYTGDSKTLVNGALNLINVALSDDSLPVESLRSITKVPADLPMCERCRCTGKVYCETCEGSGKVDCECDCGNEHTRRCDTCLGKGGTPCKCGWKPRERFSFKGAVVVEGNAYDSSLIGEYLFPVSAETFRFTIPLRDGVWIIGDEDWRLAVMPYRANEAEKEGAPKLELPKGQPA